MKGYVNVMINYESILRGYNYVVVIVYLRCMTYSNALPETLVSIVTLTKEKKGQDRREDL